MKRDTGQRSCRRRIGWVFPLLAFAGCGGGSSAETRPLLASVTASVGGGLTGGRTLSLDGLVQHGPVSADEKRPMRITLEVPDRYLVETSMAGTSSVPIRFGFDRTGPIYGVGPPGMNLGSGDRAAERSRRAQQYKIDQLRLLWLLVPGTTDLPDSAVAEVETRQHVFALQLRLLGMPGTSLEVDRQTLKPRAVEWRGSGASIGSGARPSRGGAPESSLRRIEASDFRPCGDSQIPHDLVWLTDGRVTQQLAIHSCAIGVAPRAVGADSVR